MNSSTRNGLAVSGIAFVTFGLGFGFGLGPGQAVQEAEQAKPKPAVTRTVTAAPKPAPVKTVEVVKPVEVEVVKGSCTQALGVAEQIFAAAEAQFDLVQKALSGEDVMARSQLNLEKMEMLSKRYESFRSECK